MVWQPSGALIAVTLRNSRFTLFRHYYNLMNVPDPYPTFSRPERIADAVVHAIGILFSVLATVVLIRWAQGQTSTGMVVGLAVYGAALTLSFIASACYHFTPWEGPRHILRRIDHAAIYVKIAGTYTPIVLLIGSAFAYAVLGLVWALAVIGVIAKLFFFGRPGVWGVGLYLGLGWISVTLLSSLIPLVSVTSLVLMVIGGMVYSLGAVVFSLDGLRFQNAIWHGFVLTASICFSVAIALNVLPLA